MFYQQIEIDRNSKLVIKFIKSEIIYNQFSCNKVLLFVIKMDSFSLDLLKATVIPDYLSCIFN